MKKKVIWASSLPFLALALLGCAKDKGELRGAQGQVNFSQAGAVVGRLSEALRAVEPGFSAPKATAPADAGPGAASVFATCTSISGSLVDADSDGLALTKSYRYDCLDIADGALLKSLSGSESFRDRDESRSLREAGFATAHEFTYGEKEGSRRYLRWRQGELELEPGVGEIKLRESHSEKVEEAGGAFSAKFSEQTSWDARFAPADVLNPEVGGQAELAGYYLLKGFNDRVAGFAGLDVVWEVSSRDLVYEMGCRYYKSGFLYFVDGSNNVLSIEGDCQSARASFNGSFVSTLN